jgi:hypothetical protein
MRVFDKLPRPIRDAINRADYEVCIICVRDLMRDPWMPKPVAMLENEIRRRETPT